MPTKPVTFRPRGLPTPEARNREYDIRRGSARDRGYTTRWDKSSKGYLRSHPLCAYCEADHDPRLTPATLVDHLYPQRIYADVFWSTEWWVSSCKPCHDGPKQMIERQGKEALDALALRLGRPVLATDPNG